MEMRKAEDAIRNRLLHTHLSTGRDLLAIKAKLEHGLFTAWVHDALGIKMRTAENHMAAAQLVDENAKFAHLPLPLVNAVAQAPEAMRPEIIGLVLDGTMMEATQVRDRVREKREADKRATALAKMSSKKRNHIYSEKLKRKSKVKNGTVSGSRKHAPSLKPYATKSALTHYAT